MKLITSEMDAETEKWDSVSDNEIVRRAKNMSSMAFSMYLFTRGEGPLKTTQVTYYHIQILILILLMQITLLLLRVHRPKFMSYNNIVDLYATFCGLTKLDIFLFVHRRVSYAEYDIVAAHPKR